MSEETKCAFCGAPIVEPYFKAVDGKKYAFHAKACADAFLAKRRGRNMSRVGGALGLVGGVVGLYSGLTASSMRSGSMTASSVGATSWALVALGAMVLLAGVASLLAPGKVPMVIGGSLMIVFGALMLIISAAGVLSINMVAMNMETSWPMLLLGVAMLACGGLMFGMRGGAAMAAGPIGGGPSLTTYAVVLALAVVLVVGGLSFFGRVQGPTGQQPSGMNQTSTSSTMQESSQTTTSQATSGLIQQMVALPNMAYSIAAGNYQIINFTVPANATNPTVQFSFSVTSAAMSNSIQLYVFDDANFTSWAGGLAATPVYSSHQSEGSETVNLLSGTYHIVLDNTLSGQQTVEVQFSGTVTYWN